MYMHIYKTVVHIILLLFIHKGKRKIHSTSTYQYMFNNIECMKFIKRDFKVNVLTIILKIVGDSRFSIS